ncbi:MAG TPA: GntR family transcriptional regulator, partial [Hyphomicrobiaceae bacterium]|nr:GntR family transcriptional regulator [Hyphomicrobiaceae bacterium]
MASVKTMRSNRSWLVDDAYAALKAAILANDYTSGQHISAQDIAARLGMSRTPVQEAALRLQQEGLLDILPKRGIRIRSLTHEDISEIYDVLIALEGHAAAMLAAQPEEKRRNACARLAEDTDNMAGAIARGDRA